MAVRIPQYEQRTVPGSLGVTPTARGVRVDPSAAAAGMRFASAAQGAIDTYAQIQDQIKAEKQRQEAEDAKVWTASAVAGAQGAMMSTLADLQSSAGDGAPEFTQRFNDAFNEYEEGALANAPNDTSRKFLRERLTVLRADMSGRALAFEIDERRKWRVSTGKAAVDTAAANMAADPSRLPVVLAEQRAMIDAYDLPPEQKRALREYLDTQVATATVLGEIKRNPEAARDVLAARLGVDAAEAAGAGAAPDVVWQRMLDRETIGRDQSAVSNKGAVGVAQVMPDTGPEAAKLAGLPWDPARFKTDADYNVALGRAYYDEQLRTFKHPALAAAAYNAGPSAVNEWIGRFGDPRKGEISVADFAAKIPFKETREYVAAVAPPSLTAAEAMAANPAGSRTGNLAVDLLPVTQVVSLLGTVNTELDKQRAQFRSFVAAREADDLAAYGDGKAPPQPLTSGEFVAAYGDVEGLRRWETYKHAQEFAGDLSMLKTMTPDQMRATIAERAPQPGDGYAAKARMHATLVQAAQQVLTARAEDPIAFALEAGISDGEPLDLQDADAMAAGLRERVGLAQTMAQQYGTRYTLLTKQEAAQMVGTMAAMTAPEKAQFLQTVRTSLPDPRAYQSIMSQLRPDSPVTATAGSIMAVGGQVRVGSGGMFSDAPMMSAAQVAQRVLIGEDLLNPAKSDKATDGKGATFPMPPDADLRATWADYTGTAYAGAPDTEAASYQAFRAFYAAELAAAGDYSGEFNEGAAERAAAAVTGGVADVNGSTIVLPWGMHEGHALDRLRRGWESARGAAGLGAVPFEAIDLQTVGDGVYAVIAGTGPIRGKDGQPLLLRIPREAAIPAAPASSYSGGAQ